MHNFLRTVEPKKQRLCKKDSDCMPGQIFPFVACRKGVCVPKIGKLLILCLIMSNSQILCLLSFIRKASTLTFHFRSRASTHSIMPSLLQMVRFVVVPDQRGIPSLWDSRDLPTENTSNAKTETTHVEKGCHRYSYYKDNPLKCL